jgi:hypothetical protein
METNDLCPFCNSNCKVKNDSNVSFHYICKECGEYELTYVCQGSSRFNTLSVSEKQKISQYLKQQSQSTLICRDDIELILAK